MVHELEQESSGNDIASEIPTLDNNKNTLPIRSDISDLLQQQSEIWNWDRSSLPWFNTCGQTSADLFRHKREHELLHAMPALRVVFAMEERWVGLGEGD